MDQVTCLNIIKQLNLMVAVEWAILALFVDGFVWFDSLRPSQQFFSYVRMGLPGLNQY